MSRRVCALALPVFCALFTNCATLAPRASAGPTTADYLDAASRIVGREMVDGQAFARLRYLTDHIGPRLSGSPQANLAVEWAVKRFTEDGIVARAERVMAPHWVRGDESAAILAPASQRLHAVALGGSIPTPTGGITGQVVEVSSFDELHALGDRVKGKIVLYNKAMTREGEFTAPGSGTGYGAVVPMRHGGAIEAAKQGAVGALIRSLGTADYRLPHTGAMAYDDNVTKIPFAAITAEDAELIHRLLEDGGPVTVSYALGCQTLPDVPSANVVAEIVGSEKPDEVVVIGGHLDSWDLGTGAIDDGAGCAIVMEAMRLIHVLDLKPRRTIRAVLFMNEENGLAGGKAYATDHRSELAKHVAAIESDSGAARPVGFGISGGAGAEERVREIASLVKSFGAGDVKKGGGGADISPMRDAGVPFLSLRQEGTHYFDYHHTPADTLDKVDPFELSQNAAAMAVMAYVLADMPDTLARQEPESPTRASK
ncbi:MAG: M20/M25/M40 family metallo-hydrolase [Planctomycetes bacterium]|nr:M20/M25/M40 family metallo-hydrolase [Planctomycetota bacterium]MBI3846593.1 M20/M25/M40 family metallo-hydrolase [Planctomycetota bacterium]